MQVKEAQLGFHTCRLDMRHMRSKRGVHCSSKLLFCGTRLLDFEGSITLTAVQCFQDLCHAEVYMKNRFTFISNNTSAFHSHYPAFSNRKAEPNALPECHRASSGGFRRAGSCPPCPPDECRGPHVTRKPWAIGPAVLHPPRWTRVEG